mgnify:FL=1
MTKICGIKLKAKQKGMTPLSHLVDWWRGSQLHAEAAPVLRKMLSPMNVICRASGLRIAVEEYILVQERNESGRKRILRRYI